MDHSFTRYHLELALVSKFSLEARGLGSGQVKLNTDSSFKSKPQAKGLFCDQQGKWLKGFSLKLRHTTSLAARLWVAREESLLHGRWDRERIRIHVPSILN